MVCLALGLRVRVGEESEQEKDQCLPPRDILIRCRLVDTRIEIIKTTRIYMNF